MRAQIIAIVCKNRTDFEYHMEDIMKPVKNKFEKDGEDYIYSNFLIFVPVFRHHDIRGLEPDKYMETNNASQNQDYILLKEELNYNNPQLIHEIKFTIT